MSEHKEPSPHAQRIAYFATILAAGDRDEHGQVFIIGERYSPDDRKKFAEWSVNAAQLIYKTAIDVVDGGGE